MPDLLIAFITGITTGGLSCLAVQGGLLASSLAQQIEQDIQQQGLVSPVKREAPRSRIKAHIALPILLFLIAKLAAYTVLGGLLGTLGALLQLTDISRAVLLMAIGVFMVGNALRIFNVHPVFRYFSFEPPPWLTRYIRRTAKKEAQWFTPLFLGALTVFIPCGVTQAMMALAMGTGSALAGASILFAFVLGTSPLFFTVAYLATQLGSRLEANFMRFVATIVLILGLVSINSGLNLVGSPLSINGLMRLIQKPTQVEQTAPALTDTLVVKALDGGYSPNALQAKAGVPIRLKLVTNGTYSCARGFTIPALGISQLLPATGEVTFDIPPQEAGSVLRFSCSMGMYTGQIAFK